MTIYQYGSSSKGFTLLEVLVALVIFSIVFTFLLELESNHIRKVYNNFEKLKALQFFKKKELGLNTAESSFRIESRKSLFDTFIVKENIIFNSKGEEILKINTYKLINDRTKKEY